MNSGARQPGPGEPPSNRAAPREIVLLVHDRGDPRLPIETVCGLGWSKSEAVVIAEIEAGRDYFVTVGGEPVPIRIGERQGRKYLRTPFLVRLGRRAATLRPCQARSRRLSSPRPGRSACSRTTRRP